VQFPCARCGRTYEIADELVLGRAVKVACPACGNLAVHRIPAPDARPPPPPPPPPTEQPRAFADADDLDFDAALDALEGPGSGAPPAAEEAGGGAPEEPVAAAPPEASAPSSSPKRPVAKPIPRPAPPPAPSLEDEEPVLVAAALVMASNRRSRMIAAAVALGAIVAVVGGGAFALKMKKTATVSERGKRGGAESADGAGGGGSLSDADLAKLMGKKAPEPEAAPPTAAPRPAADRPKHEKLSNPDKAMLDLLAKKGDAAVTVQEDVVAQLSTSRGSLDQASIEGTLSRSSGSFQACVTRAIQASPDKKLPIRTVDLGLTIRPSGRVEKAAVQDPAVAKLPLGQCIAQAAKRMVFPGFDGDPVDIIVPLKLKVGM
jgi:hypothetical protein